MGAPDSVVTCRCLGLWVVALLAAICLTPPVFAGPATRNSEQARRYFLGDGVKQDYAKAFALFTAAAETGDPVGQNGVGACYLRGLGTKKDVATGLAWIGKAAEQGLGKAWLNLAEIHAGGEGVAKNLTTALACALVADGLGEVEARAWVVTNAVGMPGGEQRKAVAVAEKTVAEHGWKVVFNEPAGALGRFIASGTGFFVSASGHLLTCEHVIHGADRVRIVYDGKRIPVTIVATDKKLDCAVLQAAVQSPHLRLGDSAAVKLASPVFTIGFPNADIQGLSPKYTRGEISSLTGVEDDQRCFQVSVPVQSGNSGGPLADGSGCVVGMVNAQLNAKALQEAGRSLPQNVNYAIKSAILAGVLARAGVMAPVTPSPRAGSRDAVVETVKGATVLVMSYTD